VVVQWIGGQEQWLELDGKTNELIMDEWSSISELYHEAQGIIESIFTHESSLHEFLKTLPASDKRLEILQRWNDIIPRLLRHYQDALEITLTFEEKFIESVEQLIDCSRTICNASNSEIVTSFPITNQGYQSLEEILKRLNKELQLIANISQCVKPMYLVSGDIDVNDSSWKMTVLEEKDHEDASEDSTYSRVTTATHKIDLLSIECRELITQLEKKCETLVDEVSRYSAAVL
jgi:DNA repair ATPase RecN